MYFGSVRFFKHIILTVGAAMVVVPKALSIYFGMAYFSLRSQVDSTEAAGGPSQSIFFCGSVAALATKQNKSGRNPESGRAIGPKQIMTAVCANRCAAKDPSSGAYRVSANTNKIYRLLRCSCYLSPSLSKFYVTSKAAEDRTVLS